MGCCSYRFEDALLPDQGEGGRVVSAYACAVAWYSVFRRDTSRQCAGMASVFEQHLAIDDGVVDAGGEFPDTPAAGWEIMLHVLGQGAPGSRYP